MLPLEKEQVFVLLANYLETLFTKPIDLLDFSKALNNLEITEMEKIITLIKEAHK